MPTGSEQPATPTRLPRPAPIEWFYLVVGLALVVRYRWIFDDSFIYFRYVDNLLFLDAGLTFNAGEYVEGYSSPLHCLALVCLRVLRLGYPTIVILVGLTSFAAFWYLAVGLNRALTPEPSAARALNFPLAYLVANYSVASFFTAGNEAPLIHVSAMATALLLVRPESRWLSIGVAFTPLVRPELALALALTVAWIWWSTGRAPRVLLLAALAVNGTWLVFRVWYYADLFPNTFYLKTGTSLESGTNLEAGLRYLSNATAPYGYGIVFAAFALSTAALVYRGRIQAAGLRLRPRLAMLVIAIALGGWTVTSGGSAMHYYYLAFPLTLGVAALGGLVEAAAESARTRRPRAAGVVMMLVATLLVFSRYPSALSQHPVTRNESMVQLPSLEVMTDPSFFRQRDPIERQWPTVAELRAFAPTLRSRGYTEWTDAIWCNTLYAHFDVRSVHPYGLTDAVLARVDTPEAKRGHKPALAGLAREMIELQMSAGAVDRGVYTNAIEAGTAPGWMPANRETIGVLERKAFNRHDLVENLGLAFTFPPKIQL